MMATDICGTPGSAILRAPVGAAGEGLVLESEGEDTGLVQGGDTHFCI